MTDLSPGLRDRLQPVFAQLAASLQMPPFQLALDPATHRVRVDPPRVRIPVAHEAHWRRFETVPTQLVRDAAYEARKATLDEFDEAECHAFAEAFVRDHLLNAD